MKKLVELMTLTGYPEQMRENVMNFDKKRALKKIAGHKTHHNSITVAAESFWHRRR